MDCLANNSYLEGYHIENFGNFFKQHLAADREDVTICNCHLFTNLENEEKFNEEIVRFFNKQKYKGVQCPHTFAFPIHSGGNHWSLGIINIESQAKAVYLDSLYTISPKTKELLEKIGTKLAQLFYIKGPCTFE